MKINDRLEYCACILPGCRTGRLQERERERESRREREAHFIAKASFTTCLCYYACTLIRQSSRTRNSHVYVCVCVIIDTCTCFRLQLLAFVRVLYFPFAARTLPLHSFYCLSHPYLRYFTRRTLKSVLSGKNIQG